jgi:ABC-type glycerol-3-phosphate transport system permease component
VFFFAFMFTNGGDRTLPLGLANLAITSQYRTDDGMLFAGLVLVTIPMLTVYLALQRHLVKGITAGALKG